MPVSLAPDLRAHAGRNDAGDERIVRERVTFSLRFALGNFFGGHVQQTFRRGHFIHQTALQCRFGRERLAREDDVERPGQTDEPRQTGRAAPGGQQTNLRLGQSNLCRLVARGQPVIARERDLASAAHGRAVNCGHGRHRQGGDPIKHLLAEFNDLAHRRRRGFAQGLEIGRRR